MRCPCAHREVIKVHLLVNSVHLPQQLEASVVLSSGIEELRALWRKQEADARDGIWDRAGHHQQPPGPILDAEEGNRQREVEGQDQP